MIVDYKKCPPKKPSMTQERYEDLCHLFATCGYNFNKFKKRVEQLNKSAGVIQICEDCGKVDINIMSHWRECSPEEEAYRQMAQDVYWK